MLDLPKILPWSSAWKRSLHVPISTLYSDTGTG
jgi:hypothetical protein